MVSVLLAILVFLSSQQFAAALPSYKFSPVTGWEKGGLVVWVIFDFIYLVLAIYSALIVLRLPLHRLPYVSLFLSLFCAIVQSTTNSAFILVSNGASFPSADVLAGLNATASFFGNWSLPLFFLTMMLVLEDRLVVIKQMKDQQASISLWLRTLHRGLFLAVLVVATVTSSLLAAYGVAVKSLAHRYIITDVDVDFVHHKLVVYRSVNYAFIACLFMSSVYTGVLSLYVSEIMRRVSIFDKITRLIAVSTTPLYILVLVSTAVFVSVIEETFATVFTTSELSASSTVSIPPISFNDPGIFDGVFVNFFFVMTTSTMIFLGQKPHYWTLQAKGNIQVVLRNISPEASYRGLNRSTSSQSQSEESVTPTQSNFPVESRPHQD